MKSDTAFDYALAVVMHHEGGYVNDERDAGGETKYGISKRAYPDLDIKNLTEKEAAFLYYKDYWLKAKCDKLPDGLAMFHFDTAVNMGVHAANRLLQKALRVEVDGVIGPVTLKAVDRLRHDLLSRYAMLRISKYSDMAAFKVYKNGWIRRVMETFEASIVIQYEDF